MKMMLKFIMILIYGLLIQVYVYADTPMKEIRSHLEQINTLMGEAGQSEFSQWGSWVRNIVRKDKQNTKKWLKEKIDHC